MLYKAYYKLFYLVSFLTVQANKQGLIFPLSFFGPARCYTPQSNTLISTDGFNFRIPLADRNSIRRIGNFLEIKIKFLDFEEKFLQFNSSRWNETIA